MGALGRVVGSGERQGRSLSWRTGHLRTHGGRSATDVSTVFTVAIEGPWCYLEFGDVGWCRDASRLDPRLRAAALRIAAAELARRTLPRGPGPAGSVSPHRGVASPRAGTQARSCSVRRRATARSSCALPPNGAARNSISDAGSLLRAICQSSQATQCRGSAAAEAEFRTSGGTWPRVGGLLLIAGGVLGMVLLIGFIGVRLLTAAVFSLLFLLLAPVRGARTGSR